MPDPINALPPTHADLQADRSYNDALSHVVGGAPLAPSDRTATPKEAPRTAAELAGFVHLTSDICWDIDWSNNYLPIDRITKVTPWWSSLYGARDGETPDQTRVYLDRGERDITLTIHPDQFFALYNRAKFAGEAAP